MSDQISATPPAAAKAKPRRKPARRAAPAPARPDALAGITAMNCATACRKDRCVITECGFCGHPYKASLSNAGPQTTERIARAKKLIGHQKIEAA